MPLSILLRFCWRARQGCIPALDEIEVIAVAAETRLSIHEPVISLSIDGTPRLAVALSDLA